MSRGQGLEHTKEYQWVKQPNGRFTVFNVPIFATFQDEKRGEVNEGDLASVIHNFQIDKLKNYRYPRVHIGHHDGNGNQPGAGYLDNLKLDGDMIFADLVEVTPEVFQSIRSKMKFPYVSAEYHPDKKKILSLALLESQAPFFDFPLLKLGAQQASAVNFSFQLQETPEDISQFQDRQAVWACRDKVIQFQEHFQEGCGCMEDTEKKPEDINPAGDEKKSMVEEAPQPYKCQDDIVGVKDMIARLAAQIEEIYQWEKSEHEGMDEGMGEEDMMGDEGMGEEPMPEENPEEEKEFSLTGGEPKPSLPMKGEKNPMKKPSSVAYQAPHDLVMVMQEVLRNQRDFTKRLDRLENSQNFSTDEAKLKRLCDDSGLNFQEQANVLRKFSSARDRETYMTSLSMLKPMPRHPAGAMSLPAQSMMITPADKVMQKYQQEPEQIRQFAREAYDLYRGAIEQSNQEEAKKFQKSWPSAERLVDYAVGQYPSDPQVLKRIFQS